MSSNLPVVQVAVHDGKPTVTSLQVAEAFGKDHQDVLRDIRNLSISQSFNARNFAAIKIPVVFGKGGVRSSPPMVRSLALEKVTRT